ncbi:methionine-R-sulfoxide reductase [Opitutaceae bacterium TAV1]|nr:methionine-R-sulfoxide reductase [Opitutaceae bacterium TAV1]
MNLFAAFCMPGMLLLAALLAGCDGAQASLPDKAEAPAPSSPVSSDSDSPPLPSTSSIPMPDKVVKTDAEWRTRLTPLQFHILREKGTERPGTGEYLNNEAAGVYVCAGCGQELFSSEAKFESHCGWPSFYKPVTKEAVVNSRDTSHGMDRVEITCPRCGGHLGHVFPDGPEPTGLRYCLNSAALKFVQARKAEAK